MVTLHMMMYKTDHSFGIGFLEGWTSNSTCLFSLKQNLESEPQNFPSNPTTIYTLGPTEPLVSDDFQIGCRNLKFLHVKTEIWNIKIDSVKIEKNKIKIKRCSCSVTNCRSWSRTQQMLRTLLKPWDPCEPKCNWIQVQQNPNHCSPPLSYRRECIIKKIHE